MRLHWRSRFWNFVTIVVHRCCITRQLAIVDTRQVSCRVLVAQVFVIRCIAPPSAVATDDGAQSGLPRERCTVAASKL